MRHLDYSSLAWWHKPDPARLPRRTINTSSHILIIIIPSWHYFNSHQPDNFIPYSPNFSPGHSLNSYTSTTSSPIWSLHLGLQLNLINSMNNAYADSNHQCSSSIRQSPLFLTSLILTNLLLESASAAHFLPEFDSAAKKDQIKEFQTYLQSRSGASHHFTHHIVIPSLKRSNLPF